MEDADNFIEQWVRENDHTAMAIPNIEYEAHLLISKVRKHYMDYIIKLLSFNYEKHQKLINKNIYLPSAIWRCAKIIEMTAAQSCMVVQLYRKNITAMINDLKADTRKGKLHKKLFECLKNPPQNEKKTQTNGNSLECGCVCSCGGRKKVRKNSQSPQHKKYFDKQITNELQPIDLMNTSSNINMQSLSKINKPQELIEPHCAEEVMQQLEKLFHGDSTEDDIFDGILCSSIDNIERSKNIQQDNHMESIIMQRDFVVEEHAAKIKYLDERLTSLTGTIVNKTDSTEKSIKDKKSTSKWLCEEYFLKAKLFELLDQLQDCNRIKLSRIKEMLIELFGDDSDDEGVVSPLDETPEFVTSCKERIAPWVVKLLTPYYIKGRIRGKTLFKALAKHLIRLIYKCSRYPEEYEVHSFISDFLQNHKMIRCEADFKEFRIDNIN